MSSTYLRTLVFSAIGAAIISVLAQITIPFGPVPFTLQTLAVGLIATLLKRKEAFFAALLYLILGAIGLPVFAGGSGGIQALFGPNAGYLWGILLFSLTTASLTETNSSWIRIFLANLLGDALLFATGVVGLHFLAAFSWSSAFTIGVLPFIITDTIKIILITLFSKPLFHALKNTPYFK